MIDPDRGATALPDPCVLDRGAIAEVLKAGVCDFMNAPLFGLFFSAVYVSGGWLLYGVASAVGREWWLVPVVLGFPLFGPFAAIGLYEVSRRIEAGEALNWRAVLGVMLAQKDRQLPSMAMVILMLFLFWIFVAHTMFALFLGLTPASTTAGEGAFDFLLRGNGPLMLVIGTIVGAGFSAVLFAISVVGLPVLLDRDVDFISAIILSFRACALNLGAMVIWGGLIALLVALAMAPMFLGLFVVLPILGHASWHMYRRLTE
jgi:uncharacterized membrane protein